MNNTLQKLSSYSPTVLRIGISLVFLWFGASQISDTANWIGFVPDFAMNITGLKVETIVLLNGLFEIIFGSALLLGFFTRIAAGLLALHMLHITFTVGFDSIGVRDFGLSIASIAIFLNGMDRFSLDTFRITKEQDSQSI